MQLYCSQFNTCFKVSAFYCINDSRENAFIIIIFFNDSGILYLRIDLALPKACHPNNILFTSFSLLKFEIIVR